MTVTESEQETETPRIRLLEAVQRYGNERMWFGRGTFGPAPELDHKHRAEQVLEEIMELVGEVEREAICAEHERTEDSWLLPS